MRALALATALIIGSIGWMGHTKAGSQYMPQSEFLQYCQEDEALMFVKWDKNYVHCINVEEINTGD